MRILAVADVPERLLYDNFSPERWRSRLDLVLACGDLDREYLEFLVSVLNVPLYFVAGNHDTAFRYQQPGGCDDLDGRLVTVGGLRIAGISGSMRYNAGRDEYQFTEREMAWRMRKLGVKVWRAGGVDIVISHAAPLHCPAFARCASPAGGGRACTHPEQAEHLTACLDAGDRCHWGFASFRQFIERFRPRYWLHGHNHLTYAWMPRLSTIGHTTVINAYGHYLLDTEMPSVILPTSASPSTLLGPSHQSRFAR
jgi:Icc-related predicted phosphoesterase